MVNFDAIAPQIAALLDAVRIPDVVLARARPDPSTAEPVDDKYQAVITFGQFQIRPNGRASLDLKAAPLQYVIYFDVWAKAYTGKTGLNQLIPAVHKALQGQGIKGLGRLGFVDCAYSAGVPKAIALYGATMMSQV